MLFNDAVSQNWLSNHCVKCLLKKGPCAVTNLTMASSALLQGSGLQGALPEGGRAGAVAPGSVLPKPETY